MSLHVKLYKSTCALQTAEISPPPSVRHTQNLGGGLGGGLGCPLARASAFGGGPSGAFLKQFLSNVPSS